MDISSMSTMLSQAEARQQVSISVLKMAMNSGKTQINDMVQMVQKNTKMIEQSVKSHIGANIDIKL